MSATSTSAAHDVATILRTSGVAGLAEARTNWLAPMSGGSALEVAVHDLRGSRGELTMGSTAGRAAVEHASVQVVVAGADSAAAQVLAYEAYKKLDGLLPASTVNGNTIFLIVCTAPPYLVRRDENGRNWYAASYLVDRAVA